MTGDIKANILFVLNMSSAREVVDIVLGSNRADGDFGDMEVSAISEISNILVASYVNALSHLMNLKLTISPPLFSRYGWSYIKRSCCTVWRSRRLRAVHRD